MRVYVEHDMTVNHNTNVVSLRAGQIVEGPLAVYLVESDCDVTIEQDDRPAGAAETGSAPAPDDQSHTPGSGEQPATEPAGETPAETPAEPTAEPGAAE